MDGTPFHSVDHALRWTFRTVGGDVLSLSSVYRMGRREKIPGELTQWDRHAQAGQIIGLLERHLSEFERCYTVAYCAGQQPARMAQDRMMVWLAGKVPTGVHSRRAIWKVWLMHCGIRIGVKALAADLGHCRTQKAIEFKRRLMDPLQGMHTLVWDRLQAPMEQAGIVVGDHVPSA